MHQTKIGQFFTKTSSSSGSPVKQSNQTKIGQFFTKASSSSESPVKHSNQTEIEKFFTKDSSSSPSASPVKQAKKGRTSKVLKFSDDESEEDKVGTVQKKKLKLSDDVEDKESKSMKRKKVKSSSEDEKDEKVETVQKKKVKSSKAEKDNNNKVEIVQKKKTESSDDEKDGTVPKKNGKSSDDEKEKEKKVETVQKKNLKSSDVKKEKDGKVETVPNKKEKSSESENKKEKVDTVQKKSVNVMGAGASPKGWNPDYDPTKAKYDPIEDASWKRGEKVPYLALAKTLESIEATSSRLAFIQILANYLRSVIVLTPEDILHSIYLCLNKLAPAYEGVELGVAETNIMKAIAQATGRAFDKIKADAGSLGDLGLVAESSRSSQKTLFQPQPLTVSGVFYKLKEVAAMSGQASHAKKISMITSMLVACKYSEARYLTRSLLGKLRIGLAEQSLLQALAQATYLTPPDQDMSQWPPKILNAGKKMSAETLKTKIEEHAYILKSCYCECPNYDILVKALMEVGIDGVQERCKLTPGIPPRPMLAQPTKGVADVLERFEGIRFTCEYKYDGERAQIHLLDDGTLNVYSRNQENNTSKYPDVLSRFSACIKGDVKSCILDSEAVAYDIEQKTILPFQVLSTRKRKDANEADIKVQVCVFAFDLLYLNGKSLVKEPLSKRREILHENFQEVPGQFLFANSIDTDSMEVVQEFLEESIKGNCEGLMVKTLDERATYELAKRSQKWLKLKKDYLDSGGDSLDLVVIGGFLGKGKRTGTYGGFLLACYDPDEEVFQSICKLGTGFSDEQLQTHSDSLKPNVIPSAKSYYRYNSQLTPDHWFDATQVWEVKCADLSLSPVHTAAEGIVDPQRGISLRFPRFLRIRDDKNIEDATSSQQVADMYKNQEQVKNSNGKAKAVDEDEFY